jgi:hypothetical protein
MTSMMTVMSRKVTKENTLNKRDKRNSFTLDPALKLLTGKKCKNPAVFLELNQLSRESSISPKLAHKKKNQVKA